MCCPNDPDPFCNEEDRFELYNSREAQEYLNNTGAGNGRFPVFMFSCYRVLLRFVCTGT